MANELLLQSLTAMLVGLGAGYVGSFMVLRRMSLVGDALSHVALPGIAISLILAINPFFGAFTALFIAIVGIWALERKTELPSETLVGIFFTMSLALGLILTPEPELLEALFGDISMVTVFDLVMTLVLVTVIIIFISKISKFLILGVISKDLIRSINIPIGRYNFIFLFLVAIVVAIGLKVTGTLLMGSLVIIPAAAAKNISVNLSQYTRWACIIGVLSALFGVFIAQVISLPAGPMIVISSGIIFVASLIFKR